MADTNRSKRRLGDFEILGELGRGGMGIVYEARQLSLNRMVALKVLAGSLGITPSAVMRFRREAEATQSPYGQSGASGCTFGIGRPMWTRELNHAAAHGTLAALIPDLASPTP